jgi:hypothetical protein
MTTKTFNDLKPLCHTLYDVSCFVFCVVSPHFLILLSVFLQSPGVILTRSPLPPLRLDQILKYKAEQGIKVYILLYKEVEYVGQGELGVV